MECPDCFGDGQICEECGSNEGNCGCDEDQNLVDCDCCDGTGKIEEDV